MPIGKEEHEVTAKLHHSHFVVPPFPSLGERMVERVPLSPERREGLDQNRVGFSRGACPGSPGFGAGLPTSHHDVGDPTGLTPRMET